MFWLHHPQPDRPPDISLAAVVALIASILIIPTAVAQASYTKTLPDLAVGQSVVLEYETRFENKVSAVEAVTPVKDARGVWKAGAYSIR